MSDKKRYTTKDAAEELGVSPARVRQLISAGRLKAEKFGRDVMIKPGDLDAVRIRRTGRPAKAIGEAK